MDASDQITGARARWDEHSERVRAARQEVRDHPAALLLSQVQTLRQTIDAIFVPNYIALRSLLLAPTEDPALAIEQVQNVRRSIMAEQQDAGLVRGLHNYLAGSYTLAEHVRALMAHQSSELVERWDAERNRYFRSDEMRFVGDLRRYIQHYAHLPILRRVSFTGAAAPVQGMTFTTGLEAATMLKWADWSAPGRKYLEHEDVIDLLPLFDTHANASVAANRWLLSQLVATIAPMEGEYNDLVVNANAVLTGLDLEQARRLTEERTAQRNSTAEPPSQIV